MFLVSNEVEALYLWIVPVQPSAPFLRGIGDPCGVAQHFWVHCKGWEQWRHLAMKVIFVLAFMTNVSKGLSYFRCQEPYGLLIAP